jgi:hypothetical protein
MKARKIPALTLLLAAFLLLAAAAGAENRLPANRTYLASIQGIGDDPFTPQFACIVFQSDGRLVAGDEVGEWFIDDRLTVSRHQMAVAFRIDVQDDEGNDVELHGLCWLEDRGPINSLACSAWGFGAGLEINFALTARPLGGETSPDALARCEAKAGAFNATLGVN